MSDRYFAKVVKIVDEYTVIIDRGAAHGVKTGDQYILVGLGEVIVDQETQEELEKLEIVRGKVKAIHVQEKISTMQSYLLEKNPDTREVTKTVSRGGPLAGIIMPSETVQEKITPGSEYAKKLVHPEIGDLVIKI